MDNITFQLMPSFEPQKPATFRFITFWTYRAWSNAAIRIPAWSRLLMGEKRGALFISNATLATGCSDPSSGKR